MHTGYDNFWMHNNNRHKTVLVPKIDNRSYAQLPDSYKQVQSGGCPSSLNGFVPSQNIAASSHENDQYRKSYDQAIWPSSVYSLPFMSSHANNFHSQEPLIAPASDFVYLTLNSQEKHDVRITNGSGTANAPPPYHTNTNYSSSAQVQINKNNNAQLPRIRVKDVYSLNNSTIPSQLEVDGSLFQTRQKIRGSDFDVVVHSRSLGSQTQEEYTNYEKYGLAELNKPPQYGVTARGQSHLKNLEQYIQHSVPFQQKSADFSSKNFEFSNRQTVPLGTFETSNPNVLLRQLLTQENILNAGVQNCQSNPLQGIVVQHNQKTNLNSADGASGDSHLLRDYSSPKNVQESTAKVDEVSFGFGSSGSAKTAPPANKINNQQNCMIKITIPHTGESSFLNLNDCGRTETGTDLSLRSLLELNEENYGISRSNSEQSQGNNEQNAKVGQPTNLDFSSPGVNLAQHIQEQDREDLFTALSNAESSFYPHTENVQQDYSTNVRKHESTITCTSLKQENYGNRTEGPQRGRNILGEKVLNWTIKTEERSEQEQPSVSSTLPSLEEPTGDSECAKTKDTSPTIAEDCVHQNNKTGDNPRPEKENERQKVSEVDSRRSSYKSNINRDKLDLLIKFLKKEEEFASTDKDSKSRKERDSNHNRRKLSKTCVVRNKNNSREMISLMSLKGSSSKPAKEIEKTEKRKNACAKDGSKTDESDDVANRSAKCNNSEPKKNDSSPVETNNENSGKDARDLSEKSSEVTQEEKTLVSAMKAFQNFKTHFCMSCNLVSSIDSFWINVVSGELRCLNCFKKMTIKVEGNAVKQVRKSKTKERSVDVNDKDEDGTKSLKSESTKKNLNVCRKSNDVEVKKKLQEVSGSPKCKETSRAEGEAAVARRQSSSGEGKAEKSARKSLKRELLENRSESIEKKVRRTSSDSAEGERSSRKVSGKEQFAKKAVGKEGLGKNDRKFDASPKVRRSSDSVREDIRHKARIFEERIIKEVRRARHSAEEHFFREEEDGRKNEPLERPGSQTRMDKVFGSEGVRKRTEQPKKRKNSDEDFCVHKVHVGHELTKYAEGHHSEARGSKEGRQKSRKSSSGHSGEEPRKKSSKKEGCVFSGERRDLKPVLYSSGRTKTVQGTERMKVKTESEDLSREGDCKKKLPQEGASGREIKRETCDSENEKRRKPEDDGGKRAPKPEGPEKAHKPLKERQNTKSGVLKERHKAHTGALKEKHKALGMM